MRSAAPLHRLEAALGERRYRVERPFGAWPANSGKVSDVAVGPDGRIHVMLRHDPLVDPDDPRIVVLSAEGRFLSAYAATEIADSHCLTAHPDGRIFAADRDMHQVVIFGVDGGRLGGLGQRGRAHAPLHHPTDVAIHPSGDIYVTSGYAGWTVHRFSAAGELIQTWGALGHGLGEFMEPHALWCMRDGRVVVVDRCNHRLQTFAPDGRCLEEWTGFWRPVAIWGDHLDRLYVTDETPSLHCLAPDGRRLGRARPMLNGAHGVSGSPDGGLYLAESNPSRLTRLVPVE